MEWRRGGPSGGVMPCGRFGANAAWLRLAVMAHNVLTGLKRIALKAEWLRARNLRPPPCSGLRTDHGHLWDLRNSIGRGRNCR